MRLAGLQLGLCLPIVAAGLAVATPAPASQQAQGARLAAICAACHDPAGTDRGIPSISRLNQSELEGALRKYKASETPSMVMHAIALSLTDEQIGIVSRYLATRGPEAPQ